MYHWVKDCPHRREHVKIRSKDKGKSEEEPEESSVTLFSKETESAIFMVDPEGLTVLAPGLV